MNILSKGIDISHWQGDFDLEQAKAFFDSITDTPLSRGNL